jgi:phage terminase large subunit-like protein
MSLLEQIALLPPDERDEILADLTPQDVISDQFVLRPSQLSATTSTRWLTALVSGRGYGKTKVLSRWVINKAKVPGTRIHLVGRTVADVRDVMVQGETGIMRESPDGFKPEYTPSIRRLVWPNGSVATTFSSESPSQLRGPQADCTAADELGAWKRIPDDSGATAWDHVLISTRLGPSPQIMVATTPKRVPVIRDLFDRARTEPGRVLLVTGSTFENRSNLAPEYLRTLSDMYAGTALERQELYGEMVLSVEGALWSEDDLPQPDPFAFTEEATNPAQLAGYPVERLTRIVSVDPGVTTGGDATGIMVIYATPHTAIQHRNAFVVEDLTDAAGTAPEQWAAVVADARQRHSLPGNQAIVVVEGNQGEELLDSVLRQADPTMPIARIRAHKSKAARATPVVLAYRRSRVTYLDDFPELNEELTGWEPGSGWSPNRMDALVHGITVTLIDDTPLRRFRPLTIHREAASNTSLTILGSGPSGWRDLSGLGSHREDRR